MAGGRGAGERSQNRPGKNSLWVPKTGGRTIGLYLGPQDHILPPKFGILLTDQITWTEAKWKVPRICQPWCPENTCISFFSPVPHSVQKAWLGKAITIESGPKRDKQRTRKYFLAFWF